MDPLDLKEKKEKWERQDSEEKREARGNQEFPDEMGILDKVVNLVWMGPRVLKAKW